MLKQVFSSNNLIIKENKSLLFDLRLIDSLQVCYKVIAKWFPWKFTWCHSNHLATTWYQTLSNGNLITKKI